MSRDGFCFCDSLDFCRKRAQKCFCGAPTCRGFIAAANSNELVKCEIVEDDGERAEISDASSTDSSDEEEMLPISSEDLLSVREAILPTNGLQLSIGKETPPPPPPPPPPIAKESSASKEAQPPSESTSKEQPCLEHYRIPKRKVDATAETSAAADSSAINNNE